MFHHSVAFIGTSYLELSSGQQRRAIWYEPENISPKKENVQTSKDMAIETKNKISCPLSVYCMTDFFV